MNKKTNRINEIVQILKINRGITVKELAAQLNVSHMTVRRDLEALSDQGIVRIFHGGAIYNPVPAGIDTKERYSLPAAVSRQTAEKIRIGEKAASLLKQGETIIIDTGSTTEYVAKHIPDNFPLTVICYSLNTLMLLYQKNACKLIFPGGYFHRETLMFESRESISLIKRNRAKTAFISASGIDIRLGVTCSTNYETDIKKALINSSQVKILLADSSKFGKISATYFADLNEFDIIITDTGISKEYKDSIKNKGIKLYTV